MSIFARILMALGLVFTLVLPACKTGPTKEPTKSENNSDLSRADAESRKARLSNIHYNLSINLDEASTSYSGKDQITFDLSDTSQPLRLDFFQGTAGAINANGQNLPATAKHKYWIELPARALKKGTNTVTVAYTQEYSREGQGLYRYVDPETKDVFLYSQFETFDANKFMPCFDQPDLRATLNLTVEAPARWTVISTTRETEVKPIGTKRKIWTFQQTPAIATYLFSLHAGPYKVWSDKFEDIPLRLFARPSMAKYIDAKEWFTYTKQGLKFYDDYFAFKYPFKKYDQVIVPEFDAGAMENVGAVTFNEDEFVSRSRMTRRQRRDLAETLLHEMAHMWFGDTVTMAWWNDLWLNESFASFMSELAMLNSTEFKEAWQDFYAEYKSWGYWEDNLVTTHPIEAPINGVKDAFATFDGITYGKGASALKQLWAYMTPANFQKGLQDYIRTYAYKNATLEQFIGSLQTHTDHNLARWADRWVRQSGTDKLSATWRCDGNRLHMVELSSIPTGGARFRPQAVQLALFHNQKPEIVNVSLEGTTTSVKGDWACPDFVYPNYDDDGYALVSLDPVSLQYVKHNLHSLQDPLLRTLVWGDVWQMVRDTEMPLGEYIQIVDKNFPAEDNEILLERIVDTISGKPSDRASVLNYWPQNSESERKGRLEFIAAVEGQYLKRLNQSKPGSDEQKFWFDAFTNVGQTPAALDRMATWAKDLKVAPGFKLDLDRRWALIRQLTRYQHPSAKSLSAKLKTIDRSDRGQKARLMIEAIQPDLNVKRKWVQIVKQAKPAISLADARSVLGSLFPVEQATYTKRFEKDFYEYLKKNGASEDDVFVQAVAAAIVPLTCDEHQSTRLKDFLNTATPFTPTVSKELKVDLQEDERCQRIRAFSAL